MRGGYLNFTQSEPLPPALHGGREGPESILLRSRIFRTMPTEFIGRLARHARVLHFDRGHALFLRGDSCTSLFVVGSGYAALVLRGEPGRERIVELRGAGECFGEDGMLGGHVHATDARMLSDGVLLCLPRAAVLDALDHHPALARGLLDNLARRNCELEQNIEAQSTRTVLERVVSFIMYNLRAHDDGAQEFTLPVPKLAIASLLDITKESFSRALRELEETGLIEVSGRSLRVPAPRRLEAICYGSRGCTHCYGCARGGLQPN